MCLKRAVDLSVRALFRRVVALIIELLALRESYIHFDILPRKVYVKRDKGIAVARDLTQKTRYFTFVKQEPSRPQRVFIENIALFIRRDVHTVDKHLSRIYLAVALFKIYLSLPYAFYLCSEQLYARFGFFLYEILVVRFLVLRYYLSLFHTPYPPE